MSGRDVVVIVDDDDDVRELLCLIVKLKGLEVHPAADCREAIRYLARERERVALVLLDYCMPGMAPRACCDGIRGLVGEEVPVVLVTAAVDVVGRAAELGLEHFLSKPFDIADLDRALELAYRPGEGAGPTPPSR